MPRPGKGYNSRTRTIAQGQDTGKDTALLTGPMGFWPFPVAKVVIVVALIRNIPKVVEAQQQGEAA